MNNAAAGAPSLPHHDESTRKPVAWELSRVIHALRLARERSQAAPRRAIELPARDALVRIVDGLRAALFPAHFGPRELSGDNVDYFVGHTLDTVMSALHTQVRCELHQRQDASHASLAARAQALTHEFARSLPGIRDLIESDVQAALEGDPAATSLDEVMFCYPGITAVTHQRLAHALHRLGAPMLARIICELAHAQTGIDIHPGAQLGERFFIDHGTGVVIGETSVIGARVRLYQGVTLGARSFPLDRNGALIKGLPRHPILEDDVVVYAGATVLGRITIGRGSSIGGNVWITHSVAPGSRITQSQACGEPFNQRRVTRESRPAY